MGAASTESITPTYPISTSSPSGDFGTSFLHFRTSLPLMEIGSQPPALSKSTISPFTELFNTSSTIETVFSSVTRIPLRNSGFNPAADIARFIALPPPWTTTVFIPTVAKNAMSFATDARICGLGSSINAPPYFTTKTDPLKRFMYEIASMSTPAFFDISEISCCIAFWAIRPY